MPHQVVEHARDRFRRFVNERIGGGREVLSTPAVVVISVPGVWTVYVATIYLLFGDPGYGLIGTYLMPVNAVLHIVGAFLQPAYNPRLWSAVAIFLPLGALSLVALWSVRPPYHAIGLALAVAVHLAIIAYVRRRAATLRALLVGGDPLGLRPTGCRVICYYREVGDGRMSCQPGQVRKEAAVASFHPGRRPASHPATRHSRVRRGRTRHLA